MVKRVMLAVVGAVVGLAGCGGSKKLVDVTEASTATCPAGGVTILRGEDDNDDGALTGDEVKSSADICNVVIEDQDQPVQLVTTSNVLAGANGCTFGGTQIDTGADNGDGGGTAGNGVLEAGEVDTTRFVCTNNGFFTRSTVAPTGPDGTNLLVTTGGNGTTGNGGNGGGIDVDCAPCSAGGHIKFYRNGSAPVSVSVPNVVADFGPTPASFTTSTTVETVGTPSSLPANTVYRDPAGDFFVWTGSASNPITGLRIAAGATVTIADTNNITFTLRNDAEIAGTLTGARNGANGRDITIVAKMIVVRDSGVIDTSGAASGNGGSIALSGQSPSAQVVVAGTLRSNGGDGATGGTGGDILVTNSLGRTTIAGTVDASGGNGSAGNGGNAGALNFQGSSSGLYLAGTITGRGGTGTATGGNGSELTLFTPALAESNSAVILTGGAGATGGQGGDTQFDARGGLHLAGSWSAFGGAGTSGAGGRGGRFEVGSLGDGSGYYAGTYSPYDTTIATSFDLRGGNGASGGAGGSFEISANYYDGAIGQEIAFFGYPKIDSRGGNGAVNAGRGGHVFMYNNESSDGIAGSTAPSGGVFVVTDIDTSSGNGQSGVAVNANYVDFETGYSGASALNPDARIVFTGTITANGGTGATAQHIGNSIFFWGINGVEVTGNITANGSSATAGDGAKGLDLYFISDHGPTQVTGNITMNAGNGTDNGGGGQYAEILGAPAMLAGQWSFRGGNGTTTGGAGGDVYLWSGPGKTTELASGFTCSVAPGSGAAPGAPGILRIDGSSNAAVAGN